MKKYVLHTFCFLFFFVGVAQNTYVPDDNFEQALIDLGYDSGPLDDYVPTGNINTVTFLPVAGREISDFTGLEDFSALTKLFCFNNNTITSLDLSQNTNLLNLNASDCPSLTSINLTQNLALEQIDIWRSGLTSLDITQNIGLLKINVPNNNLTTLDVTQNTALTRIMIDGNPMSSIDVSQNINLINFHCRNTNITTLDVTDLTNLEYFVFSWNNITDIDLSQNVNLETVYCEVTDLTFIDLSNSPLLKRLTAGGTYFTCLNLDNGATWRLQTVQLSTDNITCIKVSDLTQLSPYLAPSNYRETCPCIDGGQLSTDDFFDTDISIYPNPTLGDIHIELKENIKLENVEIYNIHGQLVKSFSTLKINIDDVPSGIYLMKITSDKGILMKKIIKK